MRRITIVGSPHLARYIADEITIKKGDEYVVGMMRGQVIGMCSWRHTGRMLHLNLLYPASEFRGQGLGTVLILDGLQRIRRSEKRKFARDAFYDSPRARAWYWLWGMSPEHHARWIQFPLPSGEPKEALRWTV